MRLQVVLAHAGIASRRRSAEIIKERRVRVNGKVVTEPGFNVDSAKDNIICSGRIVTIRKRHVYMILNKPKGVVTTASDERGRRTVLDLLPKMDERIYPVGRLDKDTTGLLILTDDGQLANRLTHPRYEIERVYVATIKGQLKDEDRTKLMKGIYLNGRRTFPCNIHFLQKGIKKTIVKIILREGRKRQIRDMFEKAGYPVLQLERVAFGPLRLHGLKRGDYRPLDKRNMAELKRSVGLAKG
ncbi:MAG: rRNA pseudouridine synthase [Candidatus Omnitrophica bacterium]|nr:rRNA pseudouridine synthase [Candidatus Omnitrophota bacterium]